MDKLLTPKQLADLLQVRPTTVYKWVHYKYVPHIKLRSLIRFKEKRVEEWLKRRERKGRNSYRIDV